MHKKEIFRCVYGSQLFGTATPESDEDFRSVVLPSKDNVLLGRAKGIVQTESRERANVAGDVDRTDLTVQAFLDLLRRSEVTAIETLFATPILRTPEWDLIWDRRDELVSANVNRFVGFSKSQVMRYGGRGRDVAAAQAVLEVLDRVKGNRAVIAHDPETMAALAALTDEHKSLSITADPAHPAVPMLVLSGRSAQLTQNARDVRGAFQKYIDRAGNRSLEAAKRTDKADLKGMYHAVRILYQAEEILLTGELRFPLACVPVLMEIRRGEHSPEACVEMCDALTERVNAAETRTALPEQVSPDVIRDLVLALHEDVVLSEPRICEQILP